MSATLKSNTGEAELTIEFASPAEYATEPGFESSIHLSGQHYDGDHTHEFRTVVNGLWLCSKDLIALRDHIMKYIGQPLERLGHEYLVGDFELARLPAQGFHLRFGQDPDASLRMNPAVFITLAAGGLRSEFHFVTDQSCLAAFAREISVQLRGPHEKAV